MSTANLFPKHVTWAHV